MEMELVADRAVAEEPDRVLAVMYRGTALVFIGTLISRVESSTADAVARYAGAGESLISAWDLWGFIEQNRRNLPERETAALEKIVDDLNAMEEDCRSGSDMSDEQ